MKYLPLTYRIDDVVASLLEQDRVAPKLIQEARAALETSLQAFELFLKNLPSRKLAWHLRQRATAVDNSLILDWKRRSDEARAAGDTRLERFLIPGFARVRFRFPQGCLFPCLPVRHPHFGLVFPLMGDTDATAPEILLALEAGAEIEALTSVELPVLTDADGHPERFFLRHLKELLAERAQHKKDKKNAASAVMEKLCKEFANSFYGKFAQGVNPRSLVQVSGESKPLGPSKLTESCVAALATGLPRGGISGFNLAIERYNAGKTPEEQITLVSATTDGLLVGLPAPADYTVVGDYYTSPTPEEMEAGAVPNLIEDERLRIENVLERFGCGGLLPLLEEYLPIRQMRRSRLDLTGDATYLEVKHLADEVRSIKTRGQLLLLSSGHCVHAAKFGHKPPLSELIENGEEYKRIMEAGGIVRQTRDAEWILDQLESLEKEDAEIPFYTFITLTGFKEMLESGGRLDMTKKIEPRKFNADFDWKRRLQWGEGQEGDAVSPFTVPHASLAAMKKHRAQMQALRKAGRVAKPELVLANLALQDRATRIRGSEPVAVARLFARGVLQGHLSLERPLASHAQLAETLNQVWKDQGLAESAPKLWKKSDLKNASRGLWEPRCIRSNQVLVQLVDSLSGAIGADAAQAKSLLFAGEEAAAESQDLLEEVVCALLQAPRMGIDPFATLFVEGRLPPRPGLLAAYHPQLTEQRLAYLESRSFIPGQRPPLERKRIARLLYRVGITGAEAQACAAVLAPSQEPGEHRQKSPRGKKCLERFVQALYQPDITPSRPLSEKVLHRLGWYGLTGERFSELRQLKFQRRDLSDTAQNRCQIRSMARCLGLDPEPYFQALLNR